MYTIVFSKTFQKSLKKLRKSGKYNARIQEKLEFALENLAKGKVLPKTYQDHKLTGDLIGRRECHIKGDLVFLYRKREDVLVLLAVDIGTHSQIFG